MPSQMIRGAENINSFKKGGVYNSYNMNFNISSSESDEEGKNIYYFFTQ
jgi:hypothetical protein